MRVRGARSVALMLVLVVATACGSTARQPSTDEGAAGVDQSLGTHAASTSGKSSAGDDNSGMLADPTGSLPSSRGRAGATANAGEAATGASATSGSVTGVTDTEIRIGYGTQKDADTAATGFGLDAAFGDQEGQAQAIVDDINARGGLLGRKLVLVFHDDKTANDNANADAAATAQCADWTQDRPVFAGLNIVGNRNRESMFGCMANARTPLLVSDLVSHTRREIEQFAPYLYAPGVATLDRWVPMWIERLDARRWFEPWDPSTGSNGSLPAKIGVPYTDNDSGRRYFDLVSKSLATVGRKVGDKFAFSANDLDALQQIPQMLLRFRSNGVTHILLPASAYLVTPAAERQGYRPRYGMTTLDALTSLTLTTSPAEQLHGTMGIGWLPVSDVDGAHDPGPVSPNQTRCLNIMKKAGQESADRLTITTQLIVCDLFFFLEAALQHAGSISASALQRGADALANGFPSAMTFVERYGAGRYDGANAVRDVAYNEKCGCFTYLDAVDRSFR